MSKVTPSPLLDFSSLNKVWPLSLRVSYDYDYYISEDDYGQEHWRTTPTFQRALKYIHVIFDVCPYWTQVTLILALAIERYILICRGSDSTILLSRNRRRIFYAITVILSILVPFLSVFYLTYLVWLEDKTAKVSQNFRLFSHYIILQLSLLIFRMKLYSGFKLFYPKETAALFSI